MIKESSNGHPAVFNEVCVGAGDVYEETLGECITEFYVLLTVHPGTTLGK